MVANQVIRCRSKRQNAEPASRAAQQRIEPETPSNCESQSNSVLKPFPHRSDSQMSPIQMGREADDPKPRVTWFKAIQAAKQATHTQEVNEELQLPDINIRLVRWPNDCDALLWIDARVFTNPLGRHGFEAILREPTGMMFVAEIHGRMAGYAQCHMTSWGWHIANIAVDSQFARQGVGRALVDHVKRKLNCKRYRLSAIVCESNLPAQLFLRANAMRCDSILRGYYADSNEQAYLFRYAKPQDQRHEE